MAVKSNDNDSIVLNGRGVDRVLALDSIWRHPMPPVLCFAGVLVSRPAPPTAPWSHPGTSSTPRSGAERYDSDIVPA